MLREHDRKFSARAFRNSIEDASGAERTEPTYLSKITDVNLLVLASTNPMRLNPLLNVLQQFPNHVGALHYLVHVYENSGKFEKALEVAAKLAALAPNSAHAQHMYGHVLPKVNRWTEAIQQFEKANSLHKAWISTNQSNTEEDWHYRHNLDLLAHAYNWTNQFEKASKAWTSLCDTFKGKYCQSLATFYIARGQYKEAIDLLGKPLPKPRSESEHMAQMEVESLKSLATYLNAADSEKPELLTRLTKSLNRGSEFTSLALKILKPKATTTDLTQIEGHVESSIKNAGFDSWSQAVLQRPGLVENRLK